MLSLLALLLACSSVRTPRLDLRVDGADGGQETYALKGKGWAYDSLLVPQMTWPDAAEWDEQTEVGVMMEFVTAQPGTYDRGGYIFFDGQWLSAEQAMLTLHVTEVNWTGNTDFPFTYAGRFDGVGLITGLTFDADFNFHNADCSGADASANCAVLWPSDPAYEQEWRVDSWSGLDTCPSAISGRFSEGDALVIPPDGTVTVGQHEAECIPASSSRSVCGASETLDIDGVTWIVATQLTPGNSYAGDAPDLFVRAGPVSEDVAGACEISAAVLTPVRGTGLNPDGV